MVEADPREMFNVHEAKTHLSKLIDRAHAGEQIILAKDGVPYAQIGPLAAAGPAARRPGRYAHLLKDVSDEAVLAPCFTDEELDAIENASIFPPA